MTNIQFIEDDVFFLILVFPSALMCAILLVISPGHGVALLAAKHIVNK